jgi:hypothetical protein
MQRIIFIEEEEEILFSNVRSLIRLLGRGHTFNVSDRANDS